MYLVFFSTFRVNLFSLRHILSFSSSIFIDVLLLISGKSS